MDRVRRAVVFADHAQFYVQDVGGQLTAEEREDYDWPEPWSTEAVDVWRIGVDGPCSIAIGTARSDQVETALRVHRTSPPVLAGAEHVVEADLAVPSGAVHVFGCTETPGPQHRAEIPAGQYRIRISHLPPGPHLHYRLDLWPSAEPAGVVVIRSGSPP
ncbi:hypothetical protein AB0C12_34020 [Actinoplanes sp. NPDC048967]|uniref:hypothetical protein n=1 Tax=Actinoplanes sp. NPDC048967 TaxID=3155269 RepID=UPI0033F4179A